MDSASLRTISTNGIRMHIAEMGSGPLVLLLHGFPDCWYSWRKQMPALANAGFHVVAPDLRGYGDTEAPEGIDKYTTFHIVGDLIGLLDYLSVDKALLVAHDWGAIIGWNLCLLRPDRIRAFVALSVYYMPRDPAGSLVHRLRSTHKDHYICKFQEPGNVEAIIENMSPRHFLKQIYCGGFTAEFKFLKDSEEVTLPAWLSELDLSYYASKFEKKGFTAPLNYYRAMDLSWELMAPWTNCKVHTPVLFMVGDKDVVYTLPGVKNFIHGGAMASFVSNLRNVLVFKGAHHFLHQENPDVVNHHMLAFLRSFSCTDDKIGATHPSKL